MPLGGGKEIILKQAFTNVVGNRALRQKLFDHVMQKKLSHAYILEGELGSGKHTVALSLAAALACERKDDSNAPLPCGDCPSCRKILSGNSPDVIYIHREENKTTLGINVIRELKSDVYVAPNDLDVKIYILEEAHLMTDEAQNAFLLTLEEPPSYVLFVLLCETSATLLETVKSRAPIWRMEPVSPEEIREFLLSHHREAKDLQGSAPQELDELVAAANGSIGRALSLLSAGERKPILRRREAAREFVRLAMGSQNSVAAMKHLLGLGQKREELLRQFQTNLLCLRDLLLLKQTEQAPLCFFADREEALTLAYSFTTPRLLRLCDCIEEACDKLRMNSNVRLTMTALAVGAGLLS